MPYPRFSPPSQMCSRRLTRTFVFARSETSHPRLCAADGAALPKQSILWMHLIQTIDFTDQNNFH